MSRTTLLGVAALIGATGFAAVETGGRMMGVRTAMTSSLWLDAAAFTLTAVLLTALYASAWERGGGVRRISAGVVYVALFPFLAALLAGLAELTVLGLWGFSGEVRTALIAGPLNLLATFTIELGVVALPVGILSVGVLMYLARRR